MKGTIIFKESNKRSKSQGLLPYLETEEGKHIKIRMLGENPFENPTLKEYEGKSVEVEGEITDTGTFLAESIKELKEDVPEGEECPTPETITEDCAEKCEECKECECDSECKCDSNETESENAPDEAKAETVTDSE